MTLTPTRTLLFVTCLAAAQASEAKELSIRERIYVQTLEKALGLKHQTAKRVSSGDGGRGLKVTFSDGSTLIRARYARSEDATEPTGWVRHTNRSRILTQSRGQQVLLIKGNLLKTSKRARRALRAGWSYLPGGEDPITSTRYEQGPGSVGWTGPQGLAYERIARNAKAAERGASGYSRHHGLSRWDARKGRELRVWEHTPRGGSHVRARTAKRAHAFLRYFKSLTGRSLPLGPGVDATVDPRILNRPSPKRERPLLLANTTWTERTRSPCKRSLSFARERDKSGYTVTVRTPKGLTYFLDGWYSNTRKILSLRLPASRRGINAVIDPTFGGSGTTVDRSLIGDYQLRDWNGVPTLLSVDRASPRAFQGNP